MYTLSLALAVLSCLHFSSTSTVDPSFDIPSPLPPPKTQTSLLSDLLLKNECFTSFNNLKQISVCLKTKLLLNLNELIRSNKTIELNSYVTLVKSKPVSDVDNRIDETSNAIPDERSMGDESEQLSGLIWKKVWQFFQTRSVRLNLDNDNAGVDDEGRKKKDKDKGGMMLMMAMGMGGMMMQMMMGKVAMIAMKALVIGKIALILSGIMALKKLTQNSGGGSAHSTSAASSDWSSRRIYLEENPSDLAYRAFAPTLTTKK
ncbi:hypothetical protein M8J76_006808 [Diaphorina citri]|nr:hypothetical protein M8J75_014127 [Diaphorina citri]KAI5713868.1 hypothetical protein M8J76_006808 [Diaphorina citri]KAI5715371.1 hypothetical protein M8J77_015026 [Diaphorina citri]